ncbi:MAG: Tol-Pal system beta propeller repeat protein TolB [Kofleriaceae bacterium]|nr:Tol-Pal system beta propeller repeat protein TolB [Kofleriaceae bacterium]MCL4228571.1 Tol-Pal system beta propeller repeat protein TolB [Myxococcales bacterium]
MLPDEGKGLTRIALAALALVLALVANVGGAAAQGGGVIIDATGAKRGKYPIAIPLAVASDGAVARELAAIQSFNLDVSGYFKVLDPKSFLADLEAEKLGIEPQRWKDVGAYGVIKYRVVTTGNTLELEARLYEVSKGNSAVLTRSYRGTKADLRKLGHAWSNEVVKYYTGEAGFFGSKLAFVSRGKGSSTVMAVDFDGANPYAISRNTSTNMLPAWSPSGGQIAYTSYMRNNPDLYVASAAGGRPTRLAAYRGMNTGASWSPDGSKLAVTLSKDGNPEIYIISARDGAILTRLTTNKAIDTSPAWSPDGSQIAFVSDREGGPQIFVVPASGGTARRVSFNGSYNTTPTWSPAKGESVIAYTTRDGGRYDIVTLDLKTKKMTRITQNEGNNEEPSFSPNGRAIAFASTRSGGSGIYIAPADGSSPAVRVYSGAVTGIDWGPAPRP